eukprot:6205031-Pleurochrysis_carterae.AAC.3
MWTMRPPKRASDAHQLQLVCASFWPCAFCASCSRAAFRHLALIPAATAAVATAAVTPVPPVAAQGEALLKLAEPYFHRSPLKCSEKLLSAACAYFGSTCGRGTSAVRAARRAVIRCIDPVRSSMRSLPKSQFHSQRLLFRVCVCARARACAAWRVTGARRRPRLLARAALSSRRCACGKDALQLPGPRGGGPKRRSRRRVRFSDVPFAHFAAQYLSWLFCPRYTRLPSTLTEHELPALYFVKPSFGDGYSPIACGSTSSEHNYKLLCEPQSRSMAVSTCRAACIAALPANCCGTGRVPAHYQSLPLCAAPAGARAHQRLLGL